jgi:hypothetical protein
LVSVLASSLALANSDLSTVLGTITVNVKDQAGVIDVGNVAVFEEPVLVASILNTKIN